MKEDENGPPSFREPIGMDDIINKFTKKMELKRQSTSFENKNKTFDEQISSTNSSLTKEQILQKHKQFVKPRIQPGLPNMPNITKTKASQDRSQVNSMKNQHKVVWVQKFSLFILLTQINFNAVKHQVFDPTPEAK